VRTEECARWVYIAGTLGSWSTHCGVLARIFGYFSSVFNIGSSYLITDKFVHLANLVLGVAISLGRGLTI
jgi:hypothetical protein